MKKCPYCAEDIQDAAIICRYCGRDLPVSIAEPITQPIKGKTSNSNVILWGIVIIIFVFVFLAMNGKNLSSKTEPTSTPQEKAWYACTLFVEKQLGISTLDAQEYTPSGVTAINTSLFSVDVYYAKLGSTYKCSLLHTASGDWQLLSLSVK